MAKKKQPKKVPNSKLKALIEESGVNAERIAADADVRAGTMSKYINNGTQPAVRRALAICRELSARLKREVTVSEVFE